MIAACSVAGRTPKLPTTKVGSAIGSTTYEHYLEILDHRVIHPYIDYQETSERVLCHQMLRSLLWCNLYRKYGGHLFRLLTGPYEVFQRIEDTNSYIQVSGQALSTRIRYGRTNHASLSGTPRQRPLGTQSTVVSPSSTVTPHSTQATSNIHGAQSNTHLHGTQANTQQHHIQGTQATPHLQSTHAIPHQHGTQATRHQHGTQANTQLHGTQSNTHLCGTQATRHQHGTQANIQSCLSRNVDIYATPRTASLQLSKDRHIARRIPRKLCLGQSNVPVTDIAIGSHKFACRPQPKTSPDRLFGRMSYARWYYEVFRCLPTPNTSCRQLKLFHSNLRSLAFAPLVEAYARDIVIHDHNKVFANAVPHWKIKQLIKKILLQLKICTLMFSKRFDFHKLSSALTKLFTCNRHTSFSVRFLTADIKLSECEWLNKITETPEDGQHRFNLFVLWLVKMLTHVMNYFFYITESRELRKRTLFFLRNYWESKVQSTFQDYIDHGVFACTAPGQIANHHLRFLAGTNKLRPILSRVKNEFPFSIRCQLKNTLACLKYLRSDPAAGLAVCADTIKHLRKLSAYQTSTAIKSRYYFVKADITKCYDSVDRELLLKILTNRLEEMDVEKFTCWTIGVVLPAHEKPTVTYTDKVDTKFSSHMSSSEQFIPKTCKEHMQQKGIGSALFVPQMKQELTSEQILREVKKHLEEVVLAIERGGVTSKYKMVQGIPQGSTLSSVLCDIYYGAMENTFMDPAIRQKGNLLLRHVDDYLLLTHSERCAIEFLTTLTSDIVRKAFSCEVKREKTLTNISPSDDGFERSYEATVQWCQYVIDLTHCTVTLPPYTTHDIQNGVSFKGLLNRHTHIQSLLLKHISVFTNPIYIDSVINDDDTIECNITKIFHLCATKFCYLQSYLLIDGDVTQHPKPWLDMIFRVSRKLYRILRNYSGRSGDELKLEPNIINTLCMEQFALSCGSWPELRPLRQLMLSHLISKKRKIPEQY